jgi:hypothetical protein
MVRGTLEMIASGERRVFKSQVSNVFVARFFIKLHSVTCGSKGNFQLIICY